ncbi:MAG: exodeoxyribonuclease V subunit beta [Methylophaga sp.]
MKPFDLKQTALQDSNLIEASAGTGKTYTLAGLYLRLILEQQLNVDQILVVTYTRAATQELRDRLRQKLSDARLELLKNPAEHQADLKRLNLAIQSFDEAAIFTIHSFCQQVLKDFAFESGSRFEMELIGDDAQMLQDVTDDFWRREVVQADSEFSAYLLSQKQSPETLLASIRKLVGKPYLTIQKIDKQDIAAAKIALQSAFDRAQKCWQSEAEAVIAFLQSGGLSKTSFKPDKVNGLIEYLSAIFESNEPPQQWPELLDLLSPEKLEKGLKKNVELPALNFWPAIADLANYYAEINNLRAVQLQHLRLQLLAFIREQLPKRKAQQQIQSYDDLLINLGAALNGEQGEWLVDRLRQQYRAALIDEFQDTDPIQYDNFRHLFADSGLPVFFVGDPKQAIYSFRGADIFTYLKAKRDAAQQHTLGKNWRSQPELVSAVNQLFAQHDAPFIYQQIPFHSVAAAREDAAALQVDEGEQAALQLFFVDSHDDKPLTIGAMADSAVTITADEIARLLNLATQKKACLVDAETGKKQSLTGGDIAVLVPSHRQASLIQQALRQRGINSVQQGRDNVFNSAQAADLQTLILALAQPDHPQRLATVLAGPLFGLTASQIFTVNQDETIFANWSEQLLELQQRWQYSGFMAMFRSLLQLNQTLQRLLKQADGERQLTNFLHLVELIQSESLRQHHRIEAVNQWLARQRDASQSDNEAAQLRLESDADLVKIMTIHASKGLEYPIVFCPFNWTGKTQSAKQDIVEYHDPEADYQPSVALTEPLLEQARQLAIEEEQAQAVRLLYVALTRARERCVVVWGNVRDVQQSAMYRLLHGTSSESMRADLATLVANNPAISVIDYQSNPPMRFQNPQAQTPDYQAKPFKGHIAEPWRIGSFSLLSRGHISEQPDYDADLVMPDESTTAQAAWDRFGFLRGRQAGNFLHKCFENIRFQADTSEIADTVKRLLPQFGISEDWTMPVSDWLFSVLNTPLSADGPKLADIAPSQRIDEMAFYFPVAGLNTAGLKQLLTQTPADSIWQALLNGISFPRLDGFMKGFIDLVFEYQGRFYIADYKSNYLGREPENYQGDALKRAMLGHQYPLQYLIYSLALHRHLQLRLPDYDPAQHFGGVYYLFIRGMQPEWEQAGVYFDAISPELLDALDALMAGGR